MTQARDSTRDVPPSHDWTHCGPAMVNPSPIFKPSLGLRAALSGSFQQHNKFTLPLLGVGRKR
jgi:hypothetical protein